MSDERRICRIVTVAGAVVLLTYAFLVLLERGMSRPITHDEQQFVAPAVLLLRDGLIPYRDFPLFHTPYLVALHAGVYLFTDHLLFGARLHSILHGWLLVVLVAAAGARALPRTATPGARLVAGSAAGALLLFQPLFMQTSGFAWNHDAGAAWALGGLILLARGLRAARPGRWLFAAGLAIAVGTGIRLSFAPVVLAYGLAPLVLPGLGAFAMRLRLLGPIVLGAFTGSAPMLVLFALAPAQFVFGNFVYPGLNTRAYAAVGTTDAMDLAGKFAFLGSKLLLAPPLFALAAAFLVAAASRRLPASAADRGHGLEVMLVLLALPFLLAGALAPTPSWPQYSFALAPFLAFGAAHAAGFRAESAGRARFLGVPLLVAAAAVAVAGGPLETALRRHPSAAAPHVLRKTLDLLAANADPVPRPDGWATRSVHRTGLEIGRRAAGQLVFTSQSILPLEGRCRIYENFAVGPFAWRVGAMLDAEERARQGIFAEGDLAAVLASHPPDAVLAPPGGHVPRILAEYARERGLVPNTLSSGEVLYLGEKRATDEDEGG